MEMKKEFWSISRLLDKKALGRIDTNPDYQRTEVWSKKQKRLLIDSILREYDVPKLYCRKTESPHNEKHEVVDGQQRIKTIWGFLNNEYKLPKDAVPVKGEEIKNQYYSNLSDNLVSNFNNYILDIVIISDADEEEIREMFARLQSGTPLNSPEKRNAMLGNMRDFVKELAKHKFFENCMFNNKRNTFDNVAAQMMLLELKGGVADIKNSGLEKMYTENKDFDNDCEKANKIKRVLNYLLKAFPEKTPELGKTNVISLYTVTSHLLDGYIIAERFGELQKWFIDFEAYRLEQKELPVEERDVKTMEYQGKTSRGSTDNKESVESRHEFLLKNLFETIPDIELKDNVREFTPEQRAVIYDKDKGICQLKITCEGEKCNQYSWEADHIEPYSNGGKTIISNGRVACPSCNSAKGNRV